MYIASALVRANVDPMNSTQWIASASIAAVVVSASAIAAALRGVRDQLRTSVFLTYTERYSKVMNEVPFEARQPGSGYRLASRPEDERIRVLGAFREYFNLCSEEMWLHKHRRIDHETWSVWEQGMRQVARFPSFLEIWQILGAEYDYYGDFQHFVADKMVPYASDQS
jgi:hypothetical protein